LHPGRQLAHRLPIALKITRVYRNSGAVLIGHDEHTASDAAEPGVWAEATSAADQEAAGLALAGQPADWAQQDQRAAGLAEA
jgi:hypothetical protein